MNSTDTLLHLVESCTTEYRKGPEVTERDAGNAHVVEVYAMPHESEATSDDQIRLVDVHFMTIAVDTAKVTQEDFVAALKEYPEPERLQGGPSYIEVGAVLGSQDLALRMFAVGEALGVWQVITPKVLGIIGPAGDELAGKGMVMCSGLHLKEQE